MSVDSINPLAKHFRQPSIYMNLPSKGMYWAEGSLDIPLNGQLAIYPMTTRDEITIRTPDALLNGQSVVSIIQSCCPQIKDAWKMPSIDVDSVLIGIRIASYGQSMDVDTICPNTDCKHENTHALDLTYLLDNIGTPNYSTPIEINGLKIKIRPQSYFESNKANQSTFEEQRLLSVVQSDDIPDEEKVKIFNEHLQNMISINIDTMAAGTQSIETEDGIIVYDYNFIKDFYNNTDARVIKAVRTRFEEIAKTTELPKPRVVCEECRQDYPVIVSFDYSRFFENAS